MNDLAASNLHATYLCPTCSTYQKTAYIVGHIPVCYHVFCTEEVKITPLCTCNVCKGLQTHPGDSFPSKQEGKRKQQEVEDEEAKEGEETENEKPQRKKSKTAVPTPTPTPKTPQLEIPQDPRVYSGQVCFACTTQRSKSALLLPYINIGRYRMLMLCKKEHLSDKTERAHTEELLKAIYEQAKQDGDHPKDTLELGSQEDEDKELEKEGEPRILCEGFLLLEPEPARCEEYVKDLPVSYTDSEDKVHTFCKPTHCLRHIIKYYNATGGKGPARGRGDRGATDGNRVRGRGRGRGNNTTQPTQNTPAQATTIGRGRGGKGGGKGRGRGNRTAEDEEGEGLSHISDVSNSESM